jgi:response regulator NasT
MGGVKTPEEEEIINRAKTTLMEYLGFTEPQAHRYIEKHAMDMRVTKMEIARNILKIYES